MRLADTRPSFAAAALMLLALATPSSASLLRGLSDAATTTVAEPCTATSVSGFHDLRRDTAATLPEGAKKHKNGAPTADYAVRGWDYPANFSLNICAPVLKGVKGVVGVDEDKWANVSAYYEMGGKYFALGLESSTLAVRGRKISLQYTNGSPCGDDDKSKDKRSSLEERGSVHSGASYRSHDNDEDSSSGPLRTPAFYKADAKDKRRKSATFSFVCDHDMIGEKAAVSFIGSTPDECAYFFDVRSAHACAGVEPHKPGSVGPGGVFAIIFFIAVAVYIGGGVFYQRTVAHSRGWRQLPNYNLWAGIWSFISDMFVIAMASCARCLPGRRGYRALSSSPHGRRRNREDENRLIDQLDEEWDD